MRIARRLAGPLVFAATAALVAPLTAQQSTTGTAGASSTQGADASATERRGARGLSAAQREEVNARIELAMSIVERLSAEAKSRGLSEGWRQATLESLLPLNSNALRRVQQQAFNLNAMGSAIAEVGDDPNLIGDPNRDLTYTPVAPCRFIDTRNVGGRLNGSLTYDLSTNGATYGGVAACNPITIFGVTDDEQIGAIAMNVTIVDPTTAPGFVAAKRTAADPITSLVNWYQAGPAVQAANQGIVSINQTPVGTIDNFVLQSSGPVHVIVDFFGAFIEPQATPVDHFITIGSQNVAANAAFSIFSAVCPAGYRVSGGGHRASQFNAPAQLAALRPAANNSIAVFTGANVATQWLCQGTNSATAQVIECYAVCSRIPGR